MKQYRMKGFSLIELMIVIAIIGIIAAVGYPSYQNSVQKSRRADAKVALNQAAALQEKHYFNNNQYSTDVDDIGGATSPEKLYTISIVLPTTAANSDKSKFTLRATATGVQLSDTDCRQFTIDQRGLTASAKSDASDSTAICW